MNKDTVTRYFRDMPEIVTPRLLLRRIRKTDYRDMYSYSRDPEVTRYLTWEPHTSENCTLRYLAYILPKYRSGEFHDWAVVWRESDKMIGTCGFTSLNCDHNYGEIGYVLHRAFWGKGIAPEAIRAIMKVGFLDMNLHRIEAKYILGNDRSRRVMEKCGMQFEGLRRQAMYVKGRYETIGVCSILASEFISKQLPGTP